MSLLTDPARSSPVTQPSMRHRILVVDDEERNRKLVSAVLAGSHEIVEAANGLEALAAVPTVDLVLLDVLLPDIDGFEVCRRIKAEKRDGFLPVIMLTALAAREDRAIGLSAGADDFLTKPLDIRELALRTQLFLSLREHDRVVRAQVAALAAQQAIIRKQLEETQHLQLLKDDLLSLIVHDLRNPLVGIVGYLELIREDAPSEAIRTYARSGCDAAARLRQLTEDILDVRRFEEQAIHPVPERLDAALFAGQAISSVEGGARARGISIRLLAAPGTILVDRKLGLRAVENLLANAVRFSDPSDSVDVSVRPVAGGTAIEIADRGPGLSDSMKVALFSKYAAEGERRGFGLGLHLVRLVVAAHGGNVSVRDRDGGGSIFRLYFPDEPPS